MKKDIEWYEKALARERRCRQREVRAHKNKIKALEEQVRLWQENSNLFKTCMNWEKQEKQELQDRLNQVYANPLY